LGERNTGSVEVIGSIPLGSTNYMSGDDLHRPPNPAFAGFFVYNVSKVAFKVFSELSKAQQELFIDFKDILVQQQMNSRYKKQETENPNFIRIESDKDNYLHQSIKKRMAVNKNGSTLEEKEVLKKSRMAVTCLILIFLYLRATLKRRLRFGKS
jgi:hypothetical protein